MAPRHSTRPASLLLCTCLTTQQAGEQGLPWLQVSSPAAALARPGRCRGTRARAHTKSPSPPRSHVPSQPPNQAGVHPMAGGAGRGSRQLPGVFRSAGLHKMGSRAPGEPPVACRAWPGTKGALGHTRADTKCVPCRAPGESHVPCRVSAWSGTRGALGEGRAWRSTRLHGSPCPLPCCSALRPRRVRLFLVYGKAHMCRTSARRQACVHQSRVRVGVKACAIWHSYVWHHVEGCGHWLHCLQSQ